MVSTMDQNPIDEYPDITALLRFLTGVDHADEMIVFRYGGARLDWVLGLKRLAEKTSAAIDELNKGDVFGTDVLLPSYDEEMKPIGTTSISLSAFHDVVEMKERNDVQRNN